MHLWAVVDELVAAWSMVGQMLLLLLLLWWSARRH